MKKFKAMILTLSLGVACVGNQMNLSAMPNPEALGNQPLPKPVLLVEPTAIANSGNRLFQDIIRFKLSKSNGECHLKIEKFWIASFRAFQLLLMSYRMILEKFLVLPY